MQESLHHDDPEKLLAQGIEAVKAGDRPRARELLARAIQLSPADDRVWLWLSGAVETDHDRQRCLERVLQINPRNEAARRGLAAIVSAASSPPAAAPPAAAPIPARAADPGPASAAPVRLPLDTTAASRHEPAAPAPAPEQPTPAAAPMRPPDESRPAAGPPPAPH